MNDVWLAAAIWGLASGPTESGKMYSQFDSSVKRKWQLEYSIDQKKQRWHWHDQLSTESQDNFRQLFTWTVDRWSVEASGDGLTYLEGSVCVHICVCLSVCLSNEMNWSIAWFDGWSNCADHFVASGNWRPSFANCAITELTGNRYTINVDKMLRNNLIFLEPIWFIWC